MKYRNSLTTGATLLLPAILLTGCAGPLKLPQTINRNTGEDIGQTRATRKEKLAQDFDRQRDDAQFEAAASNWERGDLEGCRKGLEQLLERKPDHRRARLMLADLYLFNGQAERSVEELTKALAIDPKDAMAHHSLAQVLDACGRRDDAMLHYKLAVQLEPNNQIYAQSCKFAQDLMPAVPPQKLPVVAASKVEEVKQPKSVETAAPPEAHVQLATAASGPIVGPPVPARPAAESSVPKPSEIFAAGKVDDWVKPIDTELSRGPAERPHNFGAITAAYTTAVADGPSPTPKLVQHASWNAPDGKSLRPVEPTVRLAVQPAISDEPRTTDADPRNRQTPLQQSVVALAQGDTREAIAAARRGLSETPAQSAALYRVMGAAYYRQGEFQTAQMELAQALSLDNTDALSYFLMSATLEKLNDREAADRFRATAARLDSRYRQ